jgi:hypothetical protein
MPTIDSYVAIEPWDGADACFAPGARVVSQATIHPGKAGSVVEWGRSNDAHYAFVNSDGDPEVLIDCEGPVVEWDDEPGSRDFHPGQSMGALVEMDNLLNDL